MAWRRFVASLLLIAAALVIRTSAQQIGTTDTGAISGMVIDEAGKPIAGALVVADRIVPAFHWLTSTTPTNDNRSATTDASGVYRFTGLTAGQYYLSVPIWTRTYPIPPTLTAKPGTFEAAPRPRAAATMVDADATHVMTIIGPSNVTAADAHPKMNVTTYAGDVTRPADAKTITVTAGDERRDVNIVLVQQPTVRVEGVLSGSAGPVARAAVRLYLDRRDLQAQYPIPTDTAFTDGAGRFLFMALAPGTYVVDVDRPSPPGDDLRLSATGFPAIVTRDYSAGSDLREYLPETTLTVGANDRHDVTLTLRRGALITGTVIIERPMLLANGQLISPFYIMLGGTSRPVIAVGRNQFLIDDVKPGKYRLGAGPLLEGFSIVSATLNGRDVKSTPIDVGWSGVTSLTITIGDGKGPPPPGTVIAGPPAIVSGRVAGPGGPPLGPNGLPVSTAPGAISGTVRDANGNPVAGVQVQAVKRLTLGGVAQAVAINQSAVTDEQGRYRLTNLPPGPAFVAALGPNALNVAGPSRVPAATTDADGRRTGYVLSLYPGVTSTANAGAIAVGTTEFPGVDFTLQRSPIFNVTGTASMAADATARAGGLILLSPASLDDQINGRNTWRTAVDARGHFTFTDVPPGDYSVSMLSPTGWGRTTVRVTEKGADPISLTLAPSFTVSGRIEFRGTQAATPSGADVARLTIRLNAVPLVVGTPLMVARVTPDGQFTFTGAPGGTYAIQATSPSPWIVASAIINGRDTIDLPATLTEAVTDAVLTFTDRLPAVLGTVRDVSGTIVNDGTAIVFSADPTYWTTLSRRVQVAPINPGGTFSVTMPPGKYFVVAGRDVPRAPAITPALLQSLAARAVSFEAVAGQDRTVQVRAGGG